MQVEEIPQVITPSVDHSSVPNEMIGDSEMPSTSSIASDITGRSDSLNEIMNNHVSMRTINRNFPVKLENIGVNVCFFNSICQVLYSIPSFVTYLKIVDPELIDDNVTANRLNLLRTLFEMMECATETVQTYPFVNEFRFKNYRFGQQHDAPEALNEIFECCFPYYHVRDSDQSMFRIECRNSIVSVSYTHLTLPTKA